MTDTMGRHLYRLLCVHITECLWLTWLMEVGIKILGTAPRL